MRIIGGFLKGKRFNPPKNLKARPTTDFAKEALFNILSNRFEIEHAEVLDLFSGSGGIAYEFVSRGASQVTTVDLNYNHIRAIKQQAKAWQIDHLFAIKSDAFKFITSCSKKFDLIFADPPYDLTRLSEIPEVIFKGELLNEHGMLIVEHGKDIDFSNHPNFDFTKKYSAVHFSFFKTIGT